MKNTLVGSDSFRKKCTFRERLIIQFVLILNIRLMIYLNIKMKTYFK